VGHCNDVDDEEDDECDESELLESTNDNPIDYERNISRSPGANSIEEKQKQNQNKQSSKVGVKKKKCEEVETNQKMIQDLAANSNKVLSELMARKNDSIGEGRKKFDDRDSNFAQMVYNRMKDIGDSDDKDELEERILQMIRQAKKSQLQPSLGQQLGTQQVSHSYMQNMQNQQLSASDPQHIQQYGNSAQFYRPGWSNYSNWASPAYIQPGKVVMGRDTTTSLSRHSSMNVMSPRSNVDVTEFDDGGDIASVLMRNS